MYDGKQILRFVNNYKTKDLYLIDNEMNKSIGTVMISKELNLMYIIKILIKVIYIRKLNLFLKIEI